MKHLRKEGTEIWLAVDSQHFGGIESHIYQLATGLLQFGYQPRVVFLRDYGKHPLREALQKADISIMTLAHPCRGWKEAILRHRPALIHTHGYKAGILGRIAARWYTVTCISTYHSGDANSFRVQCYRWLDEQTAPLAQAILAVSATVAERLQDDTCVIPNFVPVPKIISRTGKKIAFVGRLSHEKGPDHFTDLAKSCPEQQFTIYGDGPMRQLLEVPDNLSFAGQVDSMEPHWKDIDLLIMPSRREGLPMAALEAMAHGIPVAAYAVGGLPSLIQTQQNGFLIESGNPKQLAEAVTDWSLMSEAARRVMRDSARKTIRERYSPEIILPMIIKHYEEAYAYRHYIR
ncbi:MAG: glycosyltransferase family 4 protein [Rickettsiales bacterium]|nr:glycosyltransferase family 4 protein [Rickettsiales bacterium]